MSADPYIGEISMFAGNFAPRGWAPCDGRLLAISQNTALFSILGVTYGGDGQTTFALPDLRGRAPIHAGAGPGLTPRRLGETGGEESVTLEAGQMPLHAHLANAASGGGTSESPVNNVWASTPRGTPAYASGANAAMSPNAIGGAGGNQPHDNMQPYQAINYIIALEGVFPPRD